MIDTTNSHKGSGCGCGCGQEAVPEARLLSQWRAAPPHQIACPCQGVTKAQVLQAIETGAYTIPLLGVLTGAGRGKECARLHPQGRSCHPDLAALIQLYYHGPRP